jgi:NAD(P)H-dependent FMN reductase
MYKLKLIICSTRPGRKGPAIAAWVSRGAKKYKEFATELIDLAQINLPFFDEPNHPILRQYEHQHTREWSKIIDEADAFIFVAPEYNYGFNAVFKNAVDYLHHEWKHKAAGIVSYGGISGGTRAAQMMKQVLTTLSVMPLYEAVAIPFMAQYFNDEGIFAATEGQQKALDAMMASLLKWTASLNTMRAPGS